MKQTTKTLTKAEEQIMQALWRIETGFLKDILEAIPEPKPHNNTVATILKILIDKGAVGFKVYGRQHKYTPLIKKDEYMKNSFNGLVKNYFSGSYSQAVSFLVEKEKLSLNDLELLLKQMKKK
ncbi:MAG: BlaI/MecI/CopY family transcriptional regulator [Chitinophagaceae bacterium]|jgi:predicted transcriptional regulator|nr:BlaI/MecI/CopY family transcriptional regulator [Chitinophagaceae bacterium]